MAIETASTFAPVREAFWIDQQVGYQQAEEWRRQYLRYWPYYGRGYIQLTWASNYLVTGARIGLDLVSYPDLALNADIAAAVFVDYWTVSRPGIVPACEREDWAEVRRLVQGGDAGLDRLTRIVQRLLE